MCLYIRRLFQHSICRAGTPRVGINTAIETSTNGVIGIGFAVPINIAKDILVQILVSPSVKRPWFGISGLALSPDVAKSLGLDISGGAYIVTVAPEGPAEAAGFRGGGPG